MKLVPVLWQVQPWKHCQAEVSPCTTRRSLSAHHLSGWICPKCRARNDAHHQLWSGWRSKAPPSGPDGLGKSSSQDRQPFLVLNSLANVFVLALP